MTMNVLQFFEIAILAFASSSLAEKIPWTHYLLGEEYPSLVPRQDTEPSSTRVEDVECTHGPESRACWEEQGFSIATDFDEKWPDTGRTVSYTIEITNSTCNPDGSGERICMKINDQFPGPTLEANWGDLFSVTLINSMPDNGTGIHWHGVRHYNSNTEDGVNGITECPLAPGDVKTYTFRATQFGTGWYHSHHSTQYGDGVLGALVINGPAPSNYDVDLGPYMISDWYHLTAFQVESISNANLQNRIPGPLPDTILIDGRNKNPDGGGSYTSTTIEQGKKYRLRLINGSVDANVRVSLDGHQLQIMTADFVPVRPFKADWILLAIGQRYDVVFTADQPPGNYWFRAEFATDCAPGGGIEFTTLPGRSIFHYSSAAVSDPNSTQFDQPSGCADMSPLVPFVRNDVPREPFDSQLQYLHVDLAEEQLTTNGENIVVWGVNMSAINVKWEVPTLQYVLDGGNDYPDTYNLIEVPNEGTFMYWIIQETEGTIAPVPHPIHLHGHDFYILGTGDGVFQIESSIDSLQFNNPPRRDVAFLPGNGWLAVAFPADNPGAWLMHCHIAWHISQGLGVQFLERRSEMILPDANWENTCNNWRTYWEDPAWPKQDSGL